MAHLNIEFKARADKPGDLEAKLLSLHPFFKGEDNQCDTYFNVAKGRLKLREGNIENSLIYYERENKAGNKQSHILLYRHEPDAALKEILTVLHGVKVIVKKRRKIYFMDHVKFHFDEVDGLGTFVEVEAIDSDGSIGAEELSQQCAYWENFLGIQPGDHIAFSYSDLLLEKTG